MKKLFLLMLMALLALTSCSKPAQETAKVEEKAAAVVSVDMVKQAADGYFANFPGSRIIPADKLFASMDAGEKFMIVDIRSAEDYAKGHLKGAVNAPWGPALAKSLNWLPDDMPVYVNCYSGQTAGQTVAALNVAGIQAQSIRSGWNLGISKTAGYENYTETKENPAPDASGVKYDPAVKKAVEDFFNAIPDKGSNIIAAAKLKEKMDAEEQMTILSVRRAEDYAAGHIEGAINIPFGAGMQEQFAQLPKNQPVYVYCYTGQTAGQTVGILRVLGYDAISVKSGMGNDSTAGTGWMVEGFPVVQ